MTTPSEAAATLLLCGDVMLGRGIDQLLAHPGDPALVEAYLHDARRYIDLAAQVSGPVPQPVDDAWPWGDSLAELLSDPQAVLVLNLETSVTTGADFAPDKGIHYRMSPANLGCLLAPAPDVCVLANNHVLDFGVAGLEETLRVLSDGGLRTAGAGADLEEATAPATVDRAGRPRVVVLAYAHASSGVPAGWAATPDRPGLAVLPDLSARTAAGLAERVRAEKRRGSIVVLSLHWGSNWGYAVPAVQVRFAHWMVDAGVDVVHGHSSHHPRPAEVYADRLVLYGCGDFVNDYEGISGHERYRGELRVLHRLRLAADGALLAAELVPFRSRRLRLATAERGDLGWLAEVLDRESRPHGLRVRPGSGGRLVLVRAEA